MNSIICCKDCTKRYLACHDTCEEYKKQKEEHKKKKDYINRTKHPTLYKSDFDMLACMHKPGDYRKRGKRI